MVGIIAANSLRLSPYVFYYTHILDELGLAYEIIVPDRTPQQTETKLPQTVLLPWSQQRSTLSNYVRYAYAVREWVKSRDDFLIVLTAQNGVFCAPWLKKNYSGRYILDIRDYSHENHRLYAWMEKSAVRHAALNVISSPQFRTFLPEAEYHICHNITTPPNAEAHRFQKKQGPLVIGYVGSIAYEDQCKKLMARIQEDSRFSFHFFGFGPAEASLRAYAETLHTPRIRFYGAYQPSEKGDILQNQADILFNAYGSEAIGSRCLLSNKLYDALYYRKPLLTSPNTLMTEMSGSLACQVDLDESDLLERVWHWYQMLEPVEVDCYAQYAYQRFLNEQAETDRLVKHLLLSKTGEL